MNQVLEEKFVKKHIKNSFQDRLIFELSSKKHREKAIDRFSHQADVLLNDSYQKVKQSDLSFLKDEGNVYVVSLDKIDGTTFSGNEAFDYCWKTFSPVILIGNGFSIVKEELEGEEPKIFLSVTRSQNKK